MKTIRLSSGANQDLDEIADYIGEDNPSAADRVIVSIRKTLEVLVENPGIGCLYGRLRQNLRVFPASRPAQNYLIFYEDDADGILVLAILHGARNWQRLFQTGER